MSSENCSDTSNGDVLQKVCRDFLRNVCTRGNRCKFLHPNENEQESLTSSVIEFAKSQYLFCRDFQSSKCTRTTCRFLHCTKGEEYLFKLTGELPEGVLQDSFKKGIAFDSLNSSDAPVCKDYLNGFCRRSGKCKFRHLSQREYKSELNFNVATLPPSQSTGTVTVVDRRRGFEDTGFVNSGIGLDPELCAPEQKRRHIVGIDPPYVRETPPIRNDHSFPVPTTNRNLLFHPDTRSMTIEDENTQLRKKVYELKKQVSDLTATNESLLDQIAQLRMNSKRTTNIPAGTITNTGAPTKQLQPMTAQIQPAQASRPQQMVNAAVAASTLRTVTASVAPVSIATVSMTPVKIPPPGVHHLNYQ